MTCLVVIPTGTRNNPYQYKVVNGGGFVLRINDGENEKNYRDNQGRVNYRVKIIPAN